MLIMMELKARLRGAVKISRCFDLLYSSLDLFIFISFSCTQSLEDGSFDYYPEAKA